MCIVSHTPGPVDTSTERVNVIRSLIGHRKPSEHLLELITMAARGATWQQIAEADAQARS